MIFNTNCSIPESAFACGCGHAWSSCMCQLASFATPHYLLKSLRYSWAYGNQYQRIILLLPIHILHNVGILDGSITLASYNI